MFNINDQLLHLWFNQQLENELPLVFVVQSFNTYFGTK